jgi:hypothetical protein
MEGIACSLSKIIVNSDWSFWGLLFALHLPLQGCVEIAVYTEKSKLVPVAIIHTRMQH